MTENTLSNTASKHVKGETHSAMRTHAFLEIAHTNSAAVNRPAFKNSFKGAGQSGAHL